MPLLSPRYKVTSVGTTTLVAASSPALDSTPAVPITVSQSAGAWMLQGRGCTDLHSSGPPGGRRVVAALCPPGLCLSPAEHWTLGCVSPRLGLWCLCDWNHTLGAVQPLLRLSCSWGAAGHSIQPFRVLGPRCVVPSSSGRISSVSDSGSLRPSLPLLGSCQSSLPAPFSPGRLVKFLPIWDWAFLSWGHSPPGLSPAPWGGALPQGCFFIYFFLSSYLDRSVNSSHCSIPAVLSLNLRPNS